MTLRHHPGAVALDPAAWMPWNSTAALARLATATTDPAPDGLRTDRRRPRPSPHLHPKVPTTTVAAPFLPAR